MIRIGENDLLLFKYLFEEECLNREIINEYLWPNYHPKSVSRRLKQLKDNNFLSPQRNPFILQGNEFLFPTEKALIFYEEMFNDYGSKLSSRENTQLTVYEPYEYRVPNKDKFDIMLLSEKKYITRIRFLMENLGVDFWQSKRMYYNKYAKVPDAIFKIGKNDFAIEFEQRRKRESRYIADFKKYEKIEDINLKNIIYITYNDSTYNQLMSKFAPGLSKDLKSDWYKKYRLMKYEDLEDNKFIVKNEMINKEKDITLELKKIIKKKKKQGLINK